MCHHTIFALFYFLFEDNFQYKYTGAYILRDYLTEQSLYLEGLKHEGAYFWNFTVCCQMCLHVCHVHYLSKVHHE